MDSEWPSLKDANNYNFYVSEIEIPISYNLYMELQKIFRTLDEKEIMPLFTEY